MIKIIAADMDGTLVGKNHYISKENVTAIKEAQAAGVAFMVTTGRVYQETIPQLQEAGIQCKCLVMNGAQLRDECGKILMSIHIANTDVYKVIKQLKQEQLYIELYTDEGIFTVSEEDVVLDAVAVKLMYFIPNLTYDDALKKAKDEQEYKKLIFIDTEVFLNKNISVGKILSFSADQAKIARLREQLNKTETISASSSFPINIEITNIQAQKGIALKKYAQQEHIAMEDIMAIGDSYNDISMLSENFGFTVAMGNAIDEVKKTAKYKTLDVDQNGVAAAIRKVLHS